MKNVNLPLNKHHSQKQQRMLVGDQINSDDLDRWNVNETMIDPISGMAMNYLAIYASANEIKKEN